MLRCVSFRRRRLKGYNNFGRPYKLKRGVCKTVFVEWHNLFTIYISSGRHYNKQLTNKPADFYKIPPACICYLLKSATASNTEPTVLNIWFLYLISFFLLCELVQQGAMATAAAEPKTAPTATAPINTFPFTSIRPFRF